MPKDPSNPRPLRLLIVLPSWVGDAVMATPTLREIRGAFPGIFIGGLVRPGIDQILAGTPLIDEFHVEHPTGVLGPKFVAARLRPRRYDTALLLTNSFSTALITRIAGIPRRIGYNRDARGILLTDMIDAPRRADGRYAPVPAVDYYLRLARQLLLADRAGTGTLPMELGLTESQDREAVQILERAGVGSQPFAILNPGGNKVEKRWPAERFAWLARELRDRRGFSVLVNGSPGEREVVEAIVTGAGERVVGLHTLGMTLGSLKGVVKRARLMVTNDTGPRHIAAAMGIPVVSLFGPTDPKWTTIPHHPSGPEVELVADPTLPESEVSDDHPERCRIDRISQDAVFAAVERVLAQASLATPQ